jgi:hypothetical protein
MREGREGEREGRGEGQGKAKAKGRDTPSFSNRFTPPCKLIADLPRRKCALSRKSKENVNAATRSP